MQKLQKSYLLVPEFQKAGPPKKEGLDNRGPSTLTLFWMRWLTEWTLIRSFEGGRRGGALIYAEALIKQMQSRY